MTGGYRSNSAPWLGGASAVRPIITGGYRSLLAFWLGGASGFVAQPIPPTPEPVIVREARRWPGPPIVIYQQPDTYFQRQRKEEEEIIVL